MKLNIGDIAPDFTFITKGKKVTLHELTGIKIVFFFPRAFTPGCTAQACSVESSFDELGKLATVIGVSLDDHEKLNRFAEEYKLEYTLVSDNTREISKKYGVLRNYLAIKFADRDTFVIDAGNKIIDILHNGITGRHTKLGLNRHGEEILSIIRNL